MDAGVFLLSIVIGVLVTEIYRVVRTEWPLLYVNFASIIDPIQRRSFLHWVLFRSGPTFVAAVFLAVTVSRWGYPARPALATMANVHLFTFYSIPLINGLRTRTLKARQMLLWATSIALVAISSGIALGIYPYLEELVPRPTEMIAVIWTGLFAAIALAIFKSRFQRDSGVMTHELIALSRHEVMQKFSKQIYEISSRYSADEALLMSIAIVENIQRPSWFRALENKVGWFRRSGTYGIMQVTSKRPIDDVESIEISARDYFPNSIIREQESPDERFIRLAELARRHNSNAEFVELIEEVLSEFIDWNEIEQTATNNGLTAFMDMTKQWLNRCFELLR